jgi:hypothetical protein
VTILGYTVDQRIIGSIVALACVAIILAALKTGKVLRLGPGPNIIERSTHPVGYWAAVTLWSVFLVASVVAAVRGH